MATRRRKLVPTIIILLLAGSVWWYANRVPSVSERATLHVPTSEVISLAFSRDGKTIATGASDGTVMRWDTTTGRAGATFKQARQVCPPTFSPDGRLLATGVLAAEGRNGEVLLWDRAGRQVHAELKVKGVPRCIQFSPDGRSLTVGSADDRSVRLTTWDVEGWRERPGTRVPFDYISGASAIALTPDGRAFAACGSVGTIRVWDSSTGVERFRGMAHDDSVYSLVFSPDGRLLAESTNRPSDGENIYEPGTVRLWDTATGSLRATFQGYFRNLAFSSDGRHLAATGVDLHTAWLKSLPDSVRYMLKDSLGLYGTSSHGVTIWDVRTSRPKASVGGRDRRIVEEVFSPDGRTLATSDGVSVTLWDLGGLR